MDDLNKVSKVVKYILENRKQARNSDSYLYLKVLEYYADKQGIDLRGISIEFFLIMQHDGYFAFPIFEPSAGHARRFKRNIRNWQQVTVYTDCVSRTKKLSENLRKWCIKWLKKDILG